MTDTRLLIQGMHCGSCAARIENALTALDGVTSASVNFATMIGAVRHDSAHVSVEALCEAVRQLGFECTMQRSTRPRLATAAIPREVMDAEADDELDSHVSSCCRQEAGAVATRTLDDEDKETARAGATVSARAEATAKTFAYTFLVEGMSCASCAARIEKTVAEKFNGDSAFKFGLAFATCMASATTRSAAEFDELVALIESMGYHVRNARPRGQTVGTAANKKMRHRPSASDVVVMAGDDDDDDKTEAAHQTQVSVAEDARSARDQTRHALERSDEITQQKRYFLLSAVLSAPLMVVMLLMSFTSVLHNHMSLAKALDVGQLVLTTPIVFYCGRQFFTRAWRSWQHGAYTMDTLVALGTGCSYVYSVVALAISLTTSTYVMPYFDTAGMLTAFMLLGRYLEARAKRSTSGALLALMNLIPTESTVVMPDGSIVRMAPDAIEVGMRVRVTPGERIPIDGTVVEGISEVDEQMITGESLPKTVKPGRKVVSGTLNIAAVMVIVADKVGADTMLAQIVRITEEAQNTKPAVQRIADAVAMRFVPAVVGLAVATLVMWLLLGALHAYPDSWLVHGGTSGGSSSNGGSSAGGGGGSGGHGEHGQAAAGDASGTTKTSWVGFAFNFFIATVVAACPCALGLATPTAIMVGTGVGARHGVLVKSGVTLEAVRKTKCVLLDKTGTITRGLLSVVDTQVLALPPSPSPSADGTAPTKDAMEASAMSTPWSMALVRQVVCEVEGRSSHPIAKAVYTALLSSAASSAPRTLCTVLSAVNRSGRGMEACVRLQAAPTTEAAATAPAVATEHAVLVGNLKLLHERGVVVSRDVETMARQQLVKGYSVVLAAVDGHVCLLASLADEPKPEAAGIIAALHARGLRVKMVTGDHALVATRVAVAVGLDPQRDVVAEALPSDKAAIVRQSQDEIGPVLFVGDGINDSPALAAADVGVALGAGTEIAMEAADAVLVRSNLVDLLNLFKLSNTTVLHIYGNFVWAFTYNLVMLPLACGLLYPILHVQVPPVLAGIAMVLSSLSVLMSSLSIKLFKPYSEANFM